MTRVRSRWVRIVAIVCVLSLLLASGPAALLAQGPASKPDLTAPVRTTAGRDPQPVSQEVIDFFGDGLTAEEFVEKAGYVPRAMEQFVAKDVLVIIQLEQRPAALVYAEAKASGEAMAQGALDSYRAGLDAAQSSVMSQASALGAREISRYNTVYNGVQALVPASRLAEIAALPGVISVRRAPIHTPSVSNVDGLVGSDVITTTLLAGEGMVIGVIDTGIDYTHAALGGSGDPDDYATNDPDVRESGTFPTLKVLGGYDFAGSDYDASGDYGSVMPVPDNDPLDEYGHGTHVSSIAAGIGSADVAPGVAPAAGLIAYKVFGRQGSTSLTMDALEMAAENYIVFGYPNVINMSLGSPFGTADPLDPDVAATDAASAAGIVVVASAGNNGNVSYIAGSPGVASTALSVAATSGDFVTGPTVTVVGMPDPNYADIVYQAPAFDGGTGQYVAEMTAPLAFAGAGGASSILCVTTGRPAGEFAGKIALIERGTCNYSVKVTNAFSLGAVGTLIFNSTAGGNERATMAGTPVAIPSGFLARQDGLDLILVAGNPVTVSAVTDVSTVAEPYPNRLASFSSAGPRGYDSALKPEIAAPGASIFAADMGSGTGGVTMSGTSMASPYVAGVAALVREANPDWTPEMVKAAIMNTGMDMADGSTLPRAGAGRVDPIAAATTSLVAVGDADLVSLSFGAVYSKAITETLTGQVTLMNTGTEIITGTVAGALQPGSLTTGVAAINVVPAVFELAPGESAAFDVMVTTAVPDLVYGMTPLESYFGYVTFVPAVAAPTGALAPSPVVPGTVRVPFYFTPQPYAALDIVGDDTIVHPLTGLALFELTHTGSIPSSLWVYPALVATEEPNPAVSPNGSVRMFGLDYGWYEPSGGTGDVVIATINAWAPWHVPQPYFSEFDLYLDPNEDGVWDYVDFNFSLSWLNGTYGNDWIVIRVNLATGIASLGSSWYMYTDYNSALMEWWLPASLMGNSPTNSDFGYQLVGWDQYGTPDPTPAGSFDYLKSPLWWGIDGADTGWLGPDNRTGLIGVYINDLAGYQLAKPLGAMIVDYVGNPNNTDGAQAYFMPVDLVFKYLYWFPFMAHHAVAP